MTKFLKKIFDSIINFYNYLTKDDFSGLLADISTQDIINDLNHKETLDLDPIKDFMESYIGGVIVDIVDIKNIDDLGFSNSIKIVSKIEVDGDSLKLKLSDINGVEKSELIFFPTKFGTFVEKSSEDEYDNQSIYRISFYGSYCLEYLDSRGDGKLVYQE